MVYHKTNITGYSYIDNEIDEIKDKLSKEEQEKLEIACNRIRNVSITEGYRLSKNEGITKVN